MPRYLASYTVPGVPVLAVEFTRDAGDWIASLLLHSRGDGASLTASPIASARGANPRLALAALGAGVRGALATAVDNVAQFLP